MKSEVLAKWWLKVPFTIAGSPRDWDRCERNTSISRLIPSNV